MLDNEDITCPWIDVFPLHNEITCIPDSHIKSGLEVKLIINPLAKFCQ